MPTTVAKRAGKVAPHQAGTGRVAKGVAKRSSRPAPSKSLAKSPSKPALSVVRSEQGELQPTDYDILAAMPSDYLECRADVHSWTRLGSYEAPAGLRVRVRRCATCGTVRTATYTSRGGIIGQPRYEYPLGYQVVGHGQVSRQVARAVLFDQERVYGSQADLMRAVNRRTTRTRG